MNPLLIGLIAVSESVGVGLLGAVALRIARRYPVGVSLIAVVVITVCAMNTSTVTVTLVTRSSRLPVVEELVVNSVAGVVSLGVGLLLGRSVMAGGQRLAEATRSLGNLRFRAPADPPTAELAELAKELRLTSDKLAASRRRERAAEEARRRLIAWISHDLRSPLARLRAMAESIEDGVAVDLTDYCKKIRNDTDRLTEMVDDLFELSRIQSGTMRLTPRDVALDDLISDVVAGLYELAADRGIRLRPDRIVPVTVSVDDRVMTRVFNNLVVNAIQYSPGGTTVTIDIQPAGSWVTVSVTDECGGIPQRNLGSVFDMGWRGESSNGSESKGGGGLGLAIVQGVVRAHHGDVSVRNVPGGCCFAVRLPLANC